MVAQYREVLQSGAAGTGMLCPMLMDRVSGSLTHSKMSADECITSGSLTNVSVWRAIGGFDDWLFIDGVDFDFSRRLVKAKWDIVECPQVIMAHEIGTTRVHSFCGHKIQIMNHSPLRKFYQERNYPYIDYKLGTHSYSRELGRLCKHLWMVLLFETQKFAKMRAMLRGRADAYKKIAQMKRNGI
jgi:rhamnosyltransferase